MLHVAGMTQPLDIQRLAVVGMVAVCAWLATLSARLAFDLSALDGEVEYLVSGSG